MQTKYSVVIINICPYNPPRAYGLNRAATNSHSFLILGFVPICSSGNFNTLNAELNPICHLLALLGAHHILHVSGIRVKATFGCFGITLKVKGPRSSKSR